MGITFGDRLIDSGHYDITSEEERERDDAAAGMIWWNALDDKQRKYWMRIAGDTGRAIDAWRAFKQDFEARDKELRDSAYDCPCGGWDCSNLPEGPLHGCPNVAPRQQLEKNQNGF